MPEVAFQTSPRSTPTECVAVGDLSLQIDDGDYVVILGRSGSGKTMSDRVAVSRDGALQQFAPPQEIYSRPANAFVGGFIGSPSMNFLEGTIQRSNGTISVMLGDHRLALDASLVLQRPLLETYRHKEVIVGIRPESLHDAALVGATPANGGLRGTVELREKLGPGLFIHFNAPGPEAADTTSIADLPGDTAGMLVGHFEPSFHVREGGAVHAVVDTASLHFFDPATGQGIYGAR